MAPRATMGILGNSRRARRPSFLPIIAAQASLLLFINIMSEMKKDQRMTRDVRKDAQGDWLSQRLNRTTQGPKKAPH